MFTFLTRSPARRLAGRTLAALAVGTMLTAVDGAMAQDRDREGQRFEGQRPQRGAQRGQGQRGQRGMLGNITRRFGWLAQPDFARRDVGTIVSGLQLEAGQKAIVEALFIQYESDFRAFTDEMSSDTEAARETMDTNPELQQARESMRGGFQAAQDEIRQMIQDNEGLDQDELRAMIRERMTVVREEQEEQRRVQLEQMRKSMQPQIDALVDKAEAYSAEKLLLRTGFIENVTAQLGESQRALWPTVERQIVREHSLPRGELSGESLNLFTIVREADVLEEAVAPVLEKYEVSLHEALVQRDAELQATTFDLFRASQQENQRAATSLVNRQLQARMVVRQVNDEYLASIVELLPDEIGGYVQHLANERAYERVFRRPAAQRAIEAALEIEGLDEETLEFIEEVRVSYLAELGVMNQQLMQVIHEKEPAQMRDREVEGRGGFRFGRRGQDREPSPIDEAYTKRTEMGERYLEQLRQALTPEQFEELPVGRGGRGGRGADAARGGRGANGARGGANGGRGGRGGGRGGDRLDRMIDRMIETGGEFDPGDRGRRGRRGGGDDGA